MEDNNILLAVHQCKKLYEKWCEPIAQKYNMTKNEIDIMLFLTNNPNYNTAHDIVELRGLTKSHVSKSVESLVQKGFLSMCSDKTDRRVVHLSIKEEAHAMIKEAHIMQKSFYISLLRGFSKQEKKAMNEMLKRIIKNMTLPMETQKGE